MRENNNCIVINIIGECFNVSPGKTRRWEKKLSGRLDQGERLKIKHERFNDGQVVGPPSGDGWGRAWWRGGGGGQGGVADACHLRPPQVPQPIFGEPDYMLQHHASCSCFVFWLVTGMSTAARESLTRTKWLHHPCSHLPFGTHASVICLK